MADPIEINVRLAVECLLCDLLVGLANTNEEAVALADTHRKRHHRTALIDGEATP